MADRTPYILLTFANPLTVPKEYLPFLNRESALIYESLEGLALEDKCDVNRIPDATVEQVFNTVEKWQKRKELILFHYGGHASEKELLLLNDQGDSQTANAEGFAELLGSLPSLQLVFLNGCSTRGQVQLLLDKGVKVVIATSEPVQDRMAVDFASRFYQNLAQGKTLGSSFEQARKFLKTKYNHGVLNAEESRSFMATEILREESGTELPWGIYYQDGAEADLTWRLPQDKLGRSESEIEEERRLTNELLSNLQTGLESLQPNQEAGKFSKKLIYALVSILVVVLSFGGYLIWQNQTTAATFDLGVYFYADESKSSPIQDGTVEVIYDQSPAVEYSVRDGQIELKDLKTSLRGKEIIIQPSITGFSKAQLVQSVPEDADLIQIILEKATFESRITGTVKDAQGNPVAGAEVLISGQATQTDLLGDFDLVVPIEYGKRGRFRIIFNNKELYNGEEVISPNPIQIMVRNDG